MAVPINVKDRDVFHLTIEEYLLALTNTIDELVRLLYSCQLKPACISKAPQPDFHHLISSPSISSHRYLLSTPTTNANISQARLAPNAVTLGDFSRPLQISNFIKDIHAGFQLLNLKNDTLRRRSDGIKYAVSLPLFFSVYSSLYNTSTYFGNLQDLW